MNNTVLYLLTVLIWGSTWIAINFQLGDVAPEASITYRFALAAMVLFAYCGLRKLPLKMSLKQHAQVAAFGITLFGFNYFLLYQAQQHINSALSCIAFSTLMIFNIINARIWYKTQISKQVYLGAFLGLIGIVTLFWPEIEELSFTDATLYGLGLCLIGTLSASTGNMISIRNQRSQIPVVQANTWGMLYGAIFMSILAVVQGKSFTFEMSMPYISSLLFLSIFGSVIAFGCYLSLMNKIGAQKTSYANILFPGVAVILSTFFEGFQWHAYTVIGLVTILAGNLVIIAKPKKVKKVESVRSHDADKLAVKQAT
ncbi:DMT family transporter [Thalassotalea atypica]|uniref:DMT family transporter n=1 Tax=Thalassotalea atypica TaxID=2054316 RepID=UPI0025743CD1|nr:EamA family transporter [Thalassotalea atypica]